jgi:hypothetical protein
MFGYNSINGLSVSVHFPMENQLDYNENNSYYRLSTIGVIGRNVNDYTPHQDIGPWPCSPYSGLPHGGNDPEMCQIYSSINTHHPSIAPFVTE